MSASQDSDDENAKNEHDGETAHEDDAPLGILSELREFLVHNIWWWIVPLLLMLLIVALLVWLGSAPGAAPFIYPTQ